MRKSKVTQRWKIHEYQPLHTNCVKGMNTRMTSKVIQQLTSHLDTGEATDYKAFIVSSEDLGCVFDKQSKTKGYCMAHRIVKKLIADKKEPFVDGFSLLPSYLRKLEMANPGSVITFQPKVVVTAAGVTDSEFVRLFVMLGPQAVCASHCKPVISYDGGYFKVQRTTVFFRIHHK